MQQLCLPSHDAPYWWHRGLDDDDGDKWRVRYDGKGGRKGNSRLFHRMPGDVTLELMNSRKLGKICSNSPCILFDAQSCRRLTLKAFHQARHWPMKDKRLASFEHAEHVNVAVKCHGILTLVTAIVFLSILGTGLPSLFSLYPKYVRSPFASALPHVFSIVRAPVCRQIISDSANKRSQRSCNVSANRHDTATATRTCLSQTKTPQDRRLLETRNKIQERGSNSPSISDWRETGSSLLHFRSPSSVVGASQTSALSLVARKHGHRWRPKQTQASACDQGTSRTHASVRASARGAVAGAASWQRQQHIPRA